MASSASSSRIPPPTRSRRRSDHRHYHHHLYLAILLSTLLNTAAHGLSTEPDPTTPSPPVPALILQLNSSHQLPLQLTQQPPRPHPVDDFHSAQINIYTTPGNETNHTFQPDRALLQQRSRSSVFLGEQTAVVPRPHFINFTRLLMHRSTTPKTPLTTPKIQRKYIFIDKTTPRTKTIHDWSKRQSVAQSLITSKPSKSAKSLIKIKVVEGSDQVLVFDKTTTILPTPDSSSLANLSPTVTEAIENILRKRQSESDLMLTKSGARTRTGRPRMTTTAVPTTTLAPTTTTASTSVPETTSTGSISTSTTDRDQTETTTPLWTTVTAPDIASTENATTISMFNVDVKNIQNEEFAAEMSTVSSTVLFEDNRELTDPEVAATTTPRTTLRFDHSSSKLATEVIETSSAPSLSTSSSSPSPTEDQISSKATSSWGVNQTPASGSVYRQCHFSLLHLCPRLSMAKYASIRNMIACFGDGTIRCDKRSGKFCKMIPKEPFGGEFGESGEYAGGYESAESRIAESAEVASPSSSSGYFFCNVPLTTELCFGTARCEMPSTTTSTSTTIVPETTAPQTTTISSLAEAKVEQTTLITAEELNKLNQQNPAENTISNEPADLSLSKLEPAPSHHRPLSPLKIGLISALIAIGSLIVILVTIVAYISWSKLKNIKQQVSPTGGGHTNPITSFWSTSTSATPEMRPANGEPTPLSMTPKIDITEASKSHNNNSAAAAAHHNESPVI